MNEEKKINIEDGNLEETAEKETEQQTTSDTCEKSEAGENEENNETEEKDNTPEEKDPLDAANEQIEKLKDQLLRTIAEFDNYKKRTMKEKAELILNGSEKTVTAILPVLDDFERAMADQTDDPQAIKEGMELIFKKFVKTLEGLGVKKIDTDDKDFDVDFHEAIAMVPGMGDDKKGKVIDCVQTGYMLNDKVIRHAKVAVGQ
ncbi:MAG: nucleotide exchange factor GrpE [Prevotella sp.]|nr:nucleotide exchange factor GrpE [Prevotella sp.]